jgi:hypothetical protein
MYSKEASLNLKVSGQQEPMHAAPGRIYIAGI